MSGDRVLCFPQYFLIIKLDNMKYILNPGDKVKVFDYINVIYDEIVTIIIVDIITNEIVYQRQNGEKLLFSGQGYFE
jgi:hypothetical protein